MKAIAIEDYAYSLIESECSKNGQEQYKFMTDLIIRSLAGVSNPRTVQLNREDNVRLYQKHSDIQTIDDAKVALINGRFNVGPHAKDRAYQCGIYNLRDKLEDFAKDFTWQESYNPNGRAWMAQFDFDEINALRVVFGIHQEYTDRLFVVTAFIADKRNDGENRYARKYDPVYMANA